MKNFRFKDQTPTNYPLWDSKFIPYMEFDEKKLSICKLHNKKSSIEEQAKLQSPNVTMLPYSLTKQELGKLIHSISKVIDSHPVNNNKKDLIIKVRQTFEDTIIGQFFDEKPREKTICSLMDLPVLSRFFIDSYDNPLLKNCNDYKDLPFLVDNILQDEYKKNNQIMLTDYDSYEEFAEDFLNALIYYCIKDQDIDEDIINSHYHKLLDNIEPQSHVEKLLFEKIKILKDSLQDVYLEQVSDLYIK